jgi:hypothetical protein
MISMANVEEIRESYKPDKVSILFVGESAPARGTFFYTGDSLCTYTKEAFMLAFPKLSFSTSGDFLSFFQRTGCYLDDLSLVPVNDKTDDERKQLQREGIAGLAKRMQDYQPKAIVCMLKDKGFQMIVRESIRRAGLEDSPFRVTPFGGFGNQGKYREELKKHLSEFQQMGLFSEAVNLMG